MAEARGVSPVGVSDQHCYCCSKGWWGPVAEPALPMAAFLELKFQTAAMVSAISMVLKENWLQKPDYNCHGNDRSQLARNVLKGRERKKLPAKSAVERHRRQQSLSILSREGKMAQSPFLWHLHPFTWPGSTNGARGTVIHNRDVSVWTSVFWKRKVFYVIVLFCSEICLKPTLGENEFPQCYLVKLKARL